MADGTNEDETLNSMIGPIQHMVVELEQNRVFYVKHRV